MSSPETLLTLGILLALGRAAPRLLLCARLRGRLLRPPGFAPVLPDRLPGSLDPIFELAGSTLGALGFEARGARMELPGGGGGAGRPQRAWAHPPTGTLAVVGPPRRGSGDRPLQAFFVTRRADGSILATFDGLEHLTLGPPAGWRCEDANAAGDLSKQWAAHFERLGTEVERAPTPLALAELAVLETRAHRLALEAWERAGLVAPLVEKAAGRWLRLRGAWRLAGRILEGRRRVAAREARQARARERLPLWQSDDEGGIPPRDEATRAARAAGMAWRLARDRRARRRRSAAGVGRWIGGRRPPAVPSSAAVSALGPGVAFALAAASWSARSPLLAGLALAVAMALPRRLRATRAARRLRAELRDRDIASRRRARVAFSVVQKAPYDRIPTERRIRLVDAVLRQLEARPRRRRRAVALAGGALYVGLLVATPFAARDWLGDGEPAIAERTAAEAARGAGAPTAAEAIVLFAPTPLRTVRPGGP